jgi:hypothetical protein
MGLSLEHAGSASCRNLLRQQKNRILERWFQRFLEEHAEATASFLMKQTDRFENPVAFAFRAAAEDICQALIEDRDVDRNTLEYAMKIKAVQGSDPSSGVHFIRLLKETVREASMDSVDSVDSVPISDFEDLDYRIDRIAVIASEMFMNNRAKIAHISSTGSMR